MRKSTVTRWWRAAVLGLLAGAAEAATVTYDDLAPLLRERCLLCHSGPAAAAGLQLDSHAAMVRGGRNGPVARAGRPADSELLRRLTGERQPRMPLTGPPYLSDAEIDLFARWVADGMAAGSAAPAAAPAPARPPAGAPVRFGHVAPIFATRCAKCHTDGGLMGAPPEGYRLTSRAAILAASERARVVPGRPEASELVRRLRGQAQPRMPYNEPPLPEDDIRLIEQWIRQGAPDDRGVTAPLPVGAALRLHGRLTAVDALDGLPLVMASTARVRKAPRIGDDVEVRARLGADGSVRVERLRRR